MLDTWNPFDTNVPEELQITSLPNTIDHFMMEETGHKMPQIRQMRDKKFIKYHAEKQNIDNIKRNIADKYCDFCGQHGHISTNCDFMAKFIIATVSLNKVDVKVKKELQENYRQEQCKHEKCLKKKTSMIRKLLDNRGSKEDIEAILDINTDEDIVSSTGNVNESDADTDTLNINKTTDTKTPSEQMYHLSPTYPHNRLHTI